MASDRLTYEQRMEARIAEQNRLRHEHLGAALERACAELPEGYEVHVIVQKGAGWAELHGPDGELKFPDVDADDRLLAEVDAAILHAQEHAHG